jgi:ATP-dependent helicase/DNAse subunit B
MSSDDKEPEVVDLTISSDEGAHDKHKIYYLKVPQSTNDLAVSSLTSNDCENLITSTEDKFDLSSLEVDVIDSEEETGSPPLDNVSASHAEVTILSSEEESESPPRDKVSASHAEVTILSSEEESESPPSKKTKRDSDKLVTFYN